MEKTSFPEASPSPWAITRLSFKAGLPVAAAYLVASIGLERIAARPPAVGLALALVAVTFLLGGIGVYYWYRWIDALDELQRLIQLKSLALAVPVSLGLALGYELLSRGGVVTGYRLGALDAIGAVVAIYGVASVVLWWRNR